jgi:hypothetical protein
MNRKPAPRKPEAGFTFGMKFGTHDYGYRLLKTLKAQERQARRAEGKKPSNNALRRMAGASRITEQQWAKIRSQDRPETFVNDKRVYYRTEYLKSEHWTALRARKLKASPVCEVCGSSCRVEPHHLRYKNLFDVELEDLKTLCRRHHVLEHQRLDREK